MVTKSIVVTLALYQTMVSALKCDLGKYDELEEIVTYYQLRRYGYQYIDGDRTEVLEVILQLQELLRAKLNCEYDDFSPLLKSVFEHRDYSDELFNAVSKKLVIEAIDAKNCSLNHQFSETRFKYPEPFMDEMLRENEKIRTNYLSFQNVLDDLRLEFVYYKSVVTNKTEIKYIKSMIQNLKKRIGEPQTSLAYELEQDLITSDKEEWTYNSFIMHHIHCYIQPENSLILDHDDPVTPDTPSKSDKPTDPPTIQPTFKFWRIFLTVFSIISVAFLIIFIIIIRKHHDLGRYTHITRTPTNSGV
ncbi:hypothetical protein RF11_12677 [Thelohanellus kitauei]|uniref:Uncharacterized protein n=1 Tax=Thelohanellus kitauei TaxID=669202 RepID=A0A0C2JZ18_THEKT|nr:hypothetical protein RF11_12677 [Thelohanellus kitauei]